jgi:glutaminyl-tRNA synthetase
MHTIQGLRRKGYTPTIVNKFCESIGVARTGNENITSYNVLEHVARQEFIKTAPLTMAVTDGVLIKIVNYKELEKTEAEIPLFVADPSRGSVKYEVSEFIYIDKSDFSAEPKNDFFGLQPEKVTRLYYGPCVKLVDVKKNSNGEIDVIEVMRVPDDKKAKIIQWVSKSQAHPAEIRLFNVLLTENNPMAKAKEEGRDWCDYFNEDSIKVMKNGFVWKHLAANFNVLDRY